MTGKSTDDLESNRLWSWFFITTGISISGKTAACSILSTTFERLREDSSKTQETQGETKRETRERCQEIQQELKKGIFDGKSKHVDSGLRFCRDSLSPIGIYAHGGLHLNKDSVGYCKSILILVTVSLITCLSLKDCIQVVSEGGSLIPASRLVSGVTWVLPSEFSPR